MATEPAPSEIPDAPLQSVPDLQSKLGAITIDNEVFLIDDLALDDVIELEETFDQTLDVLMLQPRGKVLRHLVYLLKRTKDPEFTLEAAGKIRVGTLVPDDEVPPIKNRAARRASGSGRRR